jgi:hypothetical protein
MNAKAKRVEDGSDEPARPVQDEWGLFDPKQAGLQAAFRTLQNDATAQAAQAPSPAQPGATEASAARPVSVRSIQRHAPPAPSAAEPYEVPALDSAIGSRTAGAIYSVEAPVRCPLCSKSVQTFKVFRLLRTQVSFTSTLPRKGYTIVCPECEGVLSADLSGLL